MRRSSSRNFGGVDRYTKLYMDGSSLVDNSLFGKPITNSGVSTSTNTPRFGGSSLSFPNPGGSLNQLRTTANDPDFIFGSRNFVIDFWMRPAITTVTSQTLFSVWDGTNAATPTFAMTLGYGTSNYIGIWASSDHSNWDIIGVSPYQFSTATLSQWCHLAFVRSGSTCHLYVNGLRVYTAAFSGSIYQSATDAFVVGCWNSPMTGSFYGLMSQFRVSMDTDRGWTTPYIQVDSSPIVNKNVVLHLPMNGANNGTSFGDTSLYARTITNSNVITSTTQSKFGGSSAYFNGSNSVLYSTNDSFFNLSGNSWMIGLWVYATRTPGDQDCILTIDDSTSHSGSHYAIDMTVNSSGNFIPFVSNGSTEYYTASGLTNIVNGWHYLAVSMTSGVLQCYVDGTRFYNTTISGTTNWNTNMKLSIGARNGGTTLPFQGHIADLVLFNGSNNGWDGTTIPVPTAPFPSYQQDITAFTKLWIPGYGANSNLALYLSMTGANNGTSFADSSPFVRTITNSNGITSTTQSKFNGSSGYFAGSGYYLNAPSLSIGSRNFAIHFFVYSAGYSANSGFVCTNSGYGTYAGLMLRYDGLYMSNNGLGWTIGGGDWNTGMAANQWNHVAIVRNGSDIYVYVNGTRTYNGSGAFTGSLNIENCFQVNREIYNGGHTAYYQDMVVVLDSTNGWTGSTITVPTIPLSSTLVMDRSAYGRAITNTNVAVSTAQSKFNGSSLNFNGSSSVLTVPNDTTLVLGSKQFYMSFWIYMTSAPNYQAVMGHGTDTNNFWTLQYRNTGAYLGWFFYWYASGVWQIACNEGGNGQTLNAWAHIALVRNGSTFSIYRNGTRICTGTNANVIPTFTGLLSVGADVQSSFYINGNICDVTLLTDTSLGYTGGETTIPVPSKPFTLDGVPQRPYTVQPYDGIANGIDKYTKLYLPLSEPSNTFTDKSFYGKTITNTSVTSSTTLTKFGGSSAYCSGTGAYLYTPALGLASGDFAISMWVYFVAANSFACCVTTANTVAYSAIVWRLTGLHMSTTGSSWQVNNAGWTPVGFNNGQWYYLNLVRSGDNVYVYVDGTRTLATSISGTLALENGFWINNDIQGYGHQAYYNDIQVALGTDRGWTGSTITVPTKPADIPFPLPRKQLLPATIANPVLYIKGYSTTDSNTVIYDSSPYGRAITNTNVVTRTTNQKYGPSSMYFNGSSSYLSFTTNPIQTGALNRAVFVSFRAYWNTDTNFTICCIDGSGATYTVGSMVVYYYPGYGLTIAKMTGSGESGNMVRSASWAPTLSQWYHIALVWNSDGTGSIFVNGAALVANATPTGNSFGMGSAPIYTIGKNDTAYPFNGYLSEFTICDDTNLGYTGTTIPVPTGSLNFS